MGASSVALPPIRMSRALGALLIGALLTLLPLVAAASPPDPMWIAGIYDEADGDDVVALVTDKGEVIAVSGDLAANKNEKLVAHMSHTVTLTGEVTDAGGKKTIEATALKMVSK